MNETIPGNPGRCETESRRAGGAFLPLRILGMGLLLISCAGLAAAENGDKEEEGRWSRPKFHFDGAFLLEYTSNLYHVREDREEEFDTETERFDRFFEMEGPSDVFARVDLDLSWTWKDREKRKIRLSLDTTHYAFRDNGIADYSEFALGARFDLTESDRVKLEVGATPNRFRKNYSEEVFPNVEVFTHGYSEDWGASLDYERDLTDKWELAAGLSWEDRNYNEAHANRDRHGWGWTLKSSHQLTDALGLAASLSQGRIRTDAGLETGVPTDRSFDEDRASVSLRADLPSDWRLEIGADYRVREYLTDVVEDSARYGRTDRRRRFDLLALKGLTRRWSLAVQAEWLRNRSDTEASRLDEEESGYREFLGGAGLRFEF